LGFALKHRCPFFDLSGRHDIDDFHLHKVTAAQLAVDRHIEQSQIAMVFSKFQPNTDRPNVLGLQWSLLTNDATLVPSRTKGANVR